MKREEFIEEFKRLVESGDITTISGYMRDTGHSRVKVESDATRPENKDFVAVKVFKTTVIIKK